MVRAKFIKWNRKNVQLSSAYILIELFHAATMIKNEIYNIMVMISLKDVNVNTMIE